MRTATESQRPTIICTGECHVRRNIICAVYGSSIWPRSGEQLIPRNFAQGPGSLVCQLNTSKTIGFGDVKNPTLLPAVGPRRGRGGGGGDGGRRGGGA